MENAYLIHVRMDLVHKLRFHARLDLTVSRGHECLQHEPAGVRILAAVCDDGAFAERSFEVRQGSLQQH